MSGHFNGVAKRRKREAQLKIDRAGSLLVAGKSTYEIAEALDVSLRTAQRYANLWIESRPTYSISPTPEGLARFRVTRTERLVAVSNSGMRVIAKVEARIGTPQEKPSDVTSHARELEAQARLEERISRYNGVDQPTKIIEQQLRVSYQKTESEVSITFDRSPIEALARVPVPGLEITVGEALNGSTPLPALEPAAVDVLANGCTAGGETNAPTNGFSDVGATQ